MKKMVKTGAVLLAMAAANTLMAADATVSVDLASAYVFRGATLNDGMVVQPGMEIGGLAAGGFGFSFGAWGNFNIDDYDDMLESSEFSEVDLFATIAMPEVIDGLSWDLTFTQYIYPHSMTADATAAIPGGTLALNPEEADDDQEVTLGFKFDCLLQPSIAVTYGVDGGVENSWYVEAGLGHEEEIGENASVGVEATIAYASFEDDGEPGGMHNYTVGATASYSILTAGITYIGQMDDELLPDADGAYDVEVVGTVGVSVDF